MTLEPTVTQHTGNDTATRGIQVGPPPEPGADPEPGTQIVVSAGAGGCGSRVSVYGRAVYSPVRLAGGTIGF